MKTSSVSHPRLFCRVVRGWSVITGDPANGAAARHVAHCADCQAFFAAAAGLDARLRAAAPRRAQALPEGFEQRMERALSPLTRNRPVAESGSRTVLWTFFGTVAAAAVVAFLMLRPAERPGSGPTPLGNHQVATTSLPGSGAPSSGAIILQTIADDPLQREIDHVYSDARAALRFLALNFLPADTQPVEAGNTSS